MLLCPSLLQAVLKSSLSLNKYGGRSQIKQWFYMKSISATPISSRGDNLYTLTDTDRIHCTVQKIYEVKCFK